MENPSIRIDKWLWAVRLFKTRSMAADACKGGKIKMNGQALKSSKEIKPNDIISVNEGVITKTLKVTGIIGNRVGPKLAPNYYTDLTQEAEYEKLRLRHEENKSLRPKGMGRPTKKERRELEDWDWSFN